jgi:hypothetical protein
VVHEYVFDRVTAATNGTVIEGFGVRLKNMQERIRSSDWDMELDQQFEAQAIWYVLRARQTGAFRAFVRLRSRPILSAESSNGIEDGCNSLTHLRLRT